jgi:hypothetical protein
MVAGGLADRVGGTLGGRVDSAGGGPLVVSELGLTDVLVASSDRVGALVSVVRVPPVPNAPGSTYSLLVDAASSGSAWTAAPDPPGLIA